MMQVITFQESKEPPFSFVSDKSPAKPVNRVEVFYAQIKSIKSLISRLNDYLSKIERIKARKFHFKEDRLTYTASHALLRLILSKKLNIHSNEITYIAGNNHKPGLVSGNIYFNLSHTREAFAIGISRISSVGIDLENIKYNIDIQSITDLYFSKKEREYIFEVKDLAFDRFFLLWTRKEAFLKLLGIGVINDLNQIEVVKKNNVINEEIFKSSNPDIKAQKIYIYSKKLSGAYLSLATIQRTRIAFDHLNFMQTISLLEI